jgi:hypothetical protein
MVVRRQLATVGRWTLYFVYDVEIWMRVMIHLISPSGCPAFTMRRVRPEIPIVSQPGRCAWSRACMLRSSHKKEAMHNCKGVWDLVLQPVKNFRAVPTEVEG